jgi:hypothetical protein
MEPPRAGEKVVLFYDNAAEGILHRAKVKAFDAKCAK